jgi:sphingosine kinase
MAIHIFQKPENDLSTAGLVADIDIESEKFRWMGSARIDFYVWLLP